MRLTEEELTDLREKGRTHVWRFEEPKHAESGRCYSTEGEPYTVADSRRMTAGDVLRSHGKGTYDRLNVLSDGSFHDWAIWRITIDRGDRTDRPRLMQPTGRKSGDYTSDPHRAMPDEPEALSEEDLEPFAKRAEERREADRKRHKQVRYVRNAARRLPKRHKA